MALERLQKVLAQAGLAARRKAEELIVAGRVRVDGVVVTQLGVKVDPRKQRIEVDGLRVRADPVCYGVLHKPRGVVTSASDPEGRPTAQALLEDVGVRVVVVGRLDFNTSGVLLFTNDGDFAQTLSHARTSVPKVYAAMVQKYVTEEDLELFRSSIDIDGKKTRPAEVRILRREGDKTWLEITLREGKNRQIRRLGDHAGIQVVRLSRLSHAGIDAQGLRPGKWRFLTKTELLELKQQYGVPKKVHDSPAVAPKPQRPGAPAARGGSQRRPPNARSAAGPERGRGADGPRRPSGSGRAEGARSDGARSGGARSGGARSGPARSDGARPGRARSDGARSGPARSSGSARSDGARSGPARSGSARSDGARSGPARSGTARSSSRRGSR